MLTAFLCAFHRADKRKEVMKTVFLKILSVQSSSNMLFIFAFSIVLSVVIDTRLYCGMLKID